MSAGDVLLNFAMNAHVYPQFKLFERGTLRFTGCSSYRLDGTNDEGWYRGQCRYTMIAPEWGEFYELVGDDPLRDQPTDWIAVGSSQQSRHFLFYFRDDTFECIADDWMIEPGNDNPIYRVIGARS